MGRMVCTGYMKTFKPGRPIFITRRPNPYISSPALGVYGSVSQVYIFDLDIAKKIDKKSLG